MNEIELQDYKDAQRDVQLAIQEARDALNWLENCVNRYRLLEERKQIVESRLPKE